MILVPTSILKRTGIIITAIIYLLSFCAFSEASITTNGPQKEISVVLSYFEKYGFKLNQDINVMYLSRNEYFHVLQKYTKNAYYISEHSDGCTIKNTIYIVKTSQDTEFILAHELTHQLQRQLYGDTIYQQRWFVEGAADFIAADITQQKIKIHDYGIKKNLLNVNFYGTMQQLGGNKSYEQARWYVYQDAQGKPDLNYMIKKGKSLSQR